MKSASGVVGLMLVACTPANVEPVPAPAPAPVATSAEPTPTRAPVEAPEPTSSDTPEPPPSVEVADAARVRRPKVASSPGQIECYDVVCDALTELCCESHTSGACVTRDKPEGCASLELLWKYCDESADCGKGNACCYAARPDPTVYATNVCRKGTCQSSEPEECLAGGKCSRGRKCRVFEDAYDGYCR